MKKALLLCLILGCLPGFASEPYTYIIWGAANYGPNVRGGIPDDIDTPIPDKLSPDQFYNLEIAITRLARLRRPVRLYLNDITPRATRRAAKFAREFISEKGYANFDIHLWVGDIATVKLPQTDGAEWRNPDAVFFFKNTSWNTAEISRQVIFQELANASRSGLYVTSAYNEEFRRFIGEAIYYYEKNPDGLPPLATEAEGIAAGYVYPSGLFAKGERENEPRHGYAYRIAPDPTPNPVYSGRSLQRDGKVVCYEALLAAGESEESAAALMKRTFRPREIRNSRR